MRRLSIEERREYLEDRFPNWRIPRVYSDGMTEYGWKVLHDENLTIGMFTDIGWNTLINAKHGVTIKSYTQIGPFCSILSESTIGCKAGEVIIGADCEIGAYTLIMPGVKIGNNVVIGAYSYIDKDIPDNYRLVYKRYG